MKFPKFKLQIEKIVEKNEKMEQIMDAFQSIQTKYEIALKKYGLSYRVKISSKGARDIIVIRWHEENDILFDLDQSFIPTGTKEEMAKRTKEIIDYLIEAIETVLKKDHKTRIRLITGEYHFRLSNQLNDILSFINQNEKKRL